MENETWKGPGFCKSRHVREHDDFCNNPVAKDGEWCFECMCSVQGCLNKWGILWPLLGNLRLCSEHVQKPPGKYKAIVEESRSGPDDFDIPDE